MSHGNGSSSASAPVAFSLLVVRVVAGAIFFAHGAQKVFGAFGGAGLESTVEKLGTIGYPVAIGECFGGLGLALGFLSRFSAAANIVIMSGAIWMVHGANGFFLKDRGFEYNLALIGLLVPTLFAGPGMLALGRVLPLPKGKGGGPMLLLE